MARGASPRILVLNQNFVTGSQVGNPRPVYSVAAMLERGWHVDVVTSRQGYLDDRQTSPAGSETGDRLTLHRLDLGGGELHRRGASYRAFHKRAKGLAANLPRPDLVFCSSPPLPQTWLACQLAEQHGVPLVLEVRDLWPAFLEECGLVRNPISLLGLRWLEAFAYRRARRIIPVSPGFLPYLRGLDLEDKLEMPVPSGVQPADVDPESAAAWRRAEGLDGCRLMLYAGSLHPHYGIGTLLEAMDILAKRNCPVRLLVAGNGRLRDRLEATAKKSGNLVFLGPLPRNQLATVMAASDFGLAHLGPIPSFRSVIPGKLADYWSHGLPVLCTVPGVSEAMVRKSGGGSYRPAGGAVELADGVEMFSARPAEELQKEGRCGLSWVTRHLSARGQGEAVAESCAAALEDPDGAGAGPWTDTLAALNVALGGASRRLAKALADPRDPALARAVEGWLTGIAGTHGDTLPPLQIPDLLS